MKTKRLKKAKTKKPRNLQFIHVQARILHSNYECVKVYADAAGLSMNVLINMLLENWFYDMVADDVKKTEKKAK